MKKLIMGVTAMIATGALAGCAHSPTASTVSAGSGLTASSGQAVSSSAGGPSPSVVSTPADSTSPASMSAEPTLAQSSPAGPTESGASATAPVSTPTSPPAIGAHAVATVGATVVTCPDPTGADGSAPGAARPLAAGVVVTAVVRCETVTRTYPGAGTFTVQVAEVADSDLADFVAELRLPSDPRGPNVVCPLFRIATPWFALIDNHGSELRVALPTTQCGQSRASVIAALNALPFHEVAAVRIARVPSAG